MFENFTIYSRSQSHVDLMTPCISIQGVHPFFGARSTAYTIYLLDFNIQKYFEQYWNLSLQQQIAREPFKRRPTAYKKGYLYHETHRLRLLLVLCMVEIDWRWQNGKIIEICCKPRVSICLRPSATREVVSLIAFPVFRTKSRLMDSSSL